MKFIKTKIAVLMLLLYFIPCVCGLFFIKNNAEQKTIKIYDVQTNSVIQMPINKYLTGVVAAEMPASFETEALRAQAVAARTYLEYKQKCANHPECTMCTDAAHCQAYKSDEQLKQQWDDNYYKYYTKISEAVSSTDREIIVYNNQPISAVFHSTSSGRTENSEDVWSKAVPYLKSTDSAGDEQSPKYYSEKVMSLEEFKNTVISAHADADFESGIIGETTYTRGGNTDTVTIGGVSMSGGEVRSLFGLNSANFQINVAENQVRFTVYGYGHGVGMSQYGANYMAKSGYDYKDILKKYYSGVDIVFAGDEYKYN